ncbi:MAG: dTDP-4-dehydrorhamnose 3,5-epimerase [Rhodospirillaceae bacterium]|nr:MAG: dTDP-4-dehydrorhamnose 3,5-epimerase [Rhodospirillaceae bacterium]
MLIEKTPIEGVLVTSLQKFEDERGFFARTYCQQEFKDAGVDIDLLQTNVSGNKHKGTLRGLHYQDDPYPDKKIVTCTRGSIFDVVVDLRKESATYCQWFGEVLSADNRKGLYVPPGCAHGFITLQDNTDVNYLMGETFVADLARGVRWNDAAFGIEWPLQPVTMNERDEKYPDWVR